MSNKVYAYILNKSYNEIVVIDTENNNVIDRINRGNVSGGGGIALAHNGRRLYCTNSISRNISIIDTMKNKVIQPIIGLSVGYIPVDIAIGPEDKYAYVICSPEDKQKCGKLFRISLLTNKVEGDRVLVGSNPISIAIKPDGKFAYVTNNDTNEVSVINLENNTQYRIQEIMNPTDILMSYSGYFVYIAGKSYSGRLYRINTTTNKVSYMDVGFNIKGIEISKDGRYTHAIGFNKLSSVDFPRRRIHTRTIYVGENPSGIARRPIDDKLYVISDAGSIFFSTTRLEDNLCIGGDPQDITIGCIPGEEEVHLSITKLAKPDPVKVGSELTYTIEIKNIGQVTATKVRLIDTLPPNVKYVSCKTNSRINIFEDGVIKCGVPNIYPGQIKKVEITIIPEKEGVITNRVTVTSFEVISKFSNNTIIEQTIVLPAKDCSDTNIILNVSKGKETIRDYIELLCTDWTEGIYRYINFNKQYSSCSVKSIKCSILDISELDKEDKALVKVKVEGVAVFELSDGYNFYEKYEKEFSSDERNLMVYAPKGAKFNAIVEDVSCEIERLVNCKLDFYVNLTLVAESKALV